MECHFCILRVLTTAKDIVRTKSKGGDCTPTMVHQSDQDAKPRVLLTAPNRDHFAQVSLTVLDFFGCNHQS